MRQKGAITAVTTQKLAGSHKLSLNSTPEFGSTLWSVKAPLSANLSLFLLSYQPEIRGISSYKLTFTGCVLGT